MRMLFTSKSRRTIVLCIVGCALAMSFSHVTIAQFFAPPVALEVSSSVHFTPALSIDETELFFTNWGPNGNWDIYTASRDTIEDDWNAPNVLEAIDTDSREDRVALSNDGRTMIYASQRGDGKGGFDLWTSTRPDLDGDWEDPVNVGSINTSLNERGPNLSQDGKTLFFATSDPNVTNSSDLWFSTRDEISSSNWSTPKPLPNVNSNYSDADPSITPDGLELYFTSDRPRGFGDNDIYVATRNSVDDDFGAPLNLGPIINTPNVDDSPFVSTSGKLYYTRGAIRGEPNWELWVSEPSEPAPGDLNGDGSIDVDDVDLLSETIRRRRNPTVGFDLNEDNETNARDVELWVKNIRGTWIGDANLDGEFNTADLTLVFQAAEYEDGRRRNSTWAEGDWNGDQEFDTSDLVRAFSDGGFEKGYRNAAAVPEPSISMWSLLAFFFAMRCHLNRRH